MERAGNAGVVRMGVKGCCEADWPRVIAVMECFEGIHAAFGLHPWFVNAWKHRDWQTPLGTFLQQEDAAIGEIIFRNARS